MKIKINFILQPENHRAELTFKKLLFMKKLVVALFAFCAIGMSSCNTSGGGDPKAVLTAFFDAMAKKDIAAARKLATAESKSMFDLMEMGMKMQDTLDDKIKEQYDKKNMAIGEPKIEGDKATVNVKETKSGESVNFILKKEAGNWKVALDMATMMGMGVDKIKEKGMSREEMEKMNTEMEKFKTMSADSLKMMMEKGMQAMDSMKSMMEKK